MSGHLKYKVGIYLGFCSQLTVTRLEDWRHLTQPVSIPDLFERKRRPSIVLVSNQLAASLVSSYWEFLQLREYVKAVIELPLLVLYLDDERNWPVDAKTLEQFHHIARTSDELCELLSSVEVRCPKNECLGLKVRKEAKVA